MTKLVWLGCLFALGGAPIASATDAPSSTDPQAVTTAQVAPARNPRPIPTMQPIPNPGEELKPYGITAAPAPTTPAPAIPAAAQPTASTPAPETTFPVTAMGARPTGQPEPSAAPQTPSAPPPVEVPPLMASAKVMDDNAREFGLVTFKEMAHGVLIAADLSGLPPGTHAFHIHAVGKCEAPFLSAGGHFNPTGMMHGFGPTGQHAGDMTNIHVAPNGSVTFEMINAMVTLGEGASSLNDKDGSSVVIHANADDYLSDPAGNAGARIACGVVVFPK